MGKGKTKLQVAVLLTVILLFNMFAGAPVMGEESVVELILSGTAGSYLIGDPERGRGQVVVSGLTSSNEIVDLTGCEGLVYQCNPDGLVTVSASGEITANTAGAGVLTVSYQDVTKQIYLEVYDRNNNIPEEMLEIPTQDEFAAEGEIAEDITIDVQPNAIDELPDAEPFSAQESDYIRLDICQTKSYYKVGQSGQVVVRGETGEGNFIDLSGMGASYSFSNPEVLSVSSLGTITALKKGGGTLTVSYQGLSATMYLGVYTLTSMHGNAEGDDPSPSAGKVEKISDPVRTGNYSVRLSNGGQWPMYAPCYDSSVSEIWFYDDGVSTDPFYAYFQSTGNDSTYTPRRDDVSTGQYFIGFDSSVHQSQYFYRSKKGMRTYENTGLWLDTGIWGGGTGITRSEGWHQVTMVAEAGNQVFDDKGVISLYLDGMLVYEENFTNRYMGVLRPQGFGGNGTVFDDLIWYTSGNNIPQTAPVIKYAWLTGLFGPSHAVEANYLYYDANGDFELPIAGTNRSSSLITWQSSVDGESGWTDISEESQENKSFVLPENTAGQYVRAKIVPVSSTQNYGVPNTARIGEPYYTEPKLISSHGNYTDLRLELSSKQLKVFGLLEGQTWSEIDLEKERVQFESLDNDFVYVSKDGICTATRFGVVNIRVMVENPDGTVISKDCMLAFGADFCQAEGFEGWFGSTDGGNSSPFKSDDRAYRGNYSMKLTGTQSKDVYWEGSLSPVGAAEGWFYDDGTNHEVQVYFQTGTRGDTIGATAMYYVGISPGCQNYVYRDGTYQEYPVLTNIKRSVGWHQALIYYELGRSIDDGWGVMELYLDGQKIYHENYSHDNIQVIRAITKDNPDGAYFDDFNFYTIPDGRSFETAQKLKEETSCHVRWTDKPQYYIVTNHNEQPVSCVFRTDGNVDTVLSIYDKNYQLIAENDDIQQGDMNSLLRIAMSEDGSPYYLKVEGKNTGTFRILQGEKPEYKPNQQGKAGDGFSVCLKEDGTVWTWGANDRRQLGDGTNVTREVPKPISGLTDIVQISAGNSHVLALQSDGTVWAWGDNTAGQLGNGTNMNSAHPIKVEGLPPVKKVDAGFTHSIVLCENGEVWIWGGNASGQLGIGSNPDQQLTPLKLNDFTGAKDVAVNKDSGYTAIVKSDGTVWNAGTFADNYFMLGSWGQSSYYFTQIYKFSDVKEAVLGCDNMTALKENGDICYWGRLGDPAPDDKPYYAFVEFETVSAEQLNGIREIAVSHYDIMVVKNNGSVYFLHSDEKYFPSPILTLGLGQSHSLAIDESGRIWGWGNNTYGQLGEGIDAAVSNPVLLEGTINQFTGGQAYDESVTTVGYEYEQQFTNDVNIVPPKINHVHVEVLNKGEGIYKLILKETDYTYDSETSNQAPFFFWQTNDGTFLEYASDYSWVVFKSNPGAVGETVKVTVGIGDGRGYSDKRCIVLEGKR